MLIARLSVYHLTQYVQLKRIEMENRVCADGKCTFIRMRSGADV